MASVVPVSVHLRSAIPEPSAVNRQTKHMIECVASWKSGAESCNFPTSKCKFLL